MFFVAALKQLVCPFQPSGTRTGGREGGLLSSTDPQAADTHSQLLVRSMAFQLHFVLKARVWTQAEVESSPHSQPASELRLRAVWAVAGPHGSAGITSPLMWGPGAGALHTEEGTGVGANIWCLRGR